MIKWKKDIKQIKGSQNVIKVGYDRKNLSTELSNITKINMKFFEDLLKHLSVPVLLQLE